MSKNSMLTLPQINLESLSDDVQTTLKTCNITFKELSDAPWFVKLLSNIYTEPYIAYKTIIYVPNQHVSLAKSLNPTDRICATSKILPWVFAIKNNTTLSLKTLINIITSLNTRSYYFMYEFSLLKAHDIKDISDLVAIGFLSTRKNIFGRRINPDTVFDTLKYILNTKIDHIS